MHPIKGLSANFEQDAFAKQVEDGAEEALGELQRMHVDIQKIFERGAHEVGLEADAGGKDDASQIVLRKILDARKLNEVFPQMVAFLQAVEKELPNGAMPRPRRNVNEI